MKKKTQPVRRNSSLRPAAPKTGRKMPVCVVCSGAVAPFSPENLCWVCRRLKISAWRDADTQAMMQE